MQEDGSSDALLLAVFDGHGADGHLIAEFFRDALPSAVFAHPAFRAEVDEADNISPPPDGEALQALADAAGGLASPVHRASARPAVGPVRRGRDVARAVVEVLASLESQLRGRVDIDTRLSGTTACIAVVVGSVLTLVNVGDSRAALIRRAPSGALTAVPLTIDHKPTLPGETRRILLAGGRVHAIRYDDGGEGPVRVWLGKEDSPGLAMSRSLGDTVGKAAGVSSTPDVYRYTLVGRSDAFLLLASDGLWEFCTGADVAGVVGRAYASAAAAGEVTAAAAAARAAAVNAGLPPSSWPPAPEAPPVGLAHALDALAELSGARWAEREGVVDDISIIMGEVG
jgi:serine/threonine protein phosphatase PrpC